MFDFNSGARRAVSDDARANRLTAAQDLVQRTLAQHGLAGSAQSSSSLDTASLMNMLQKVLPKNGLSIGLTKEEAQDSLDGARFLSGTHQAKSGSRDYRVYVPAAVETRASGIVMMLHGCTQTPEDFAIGTGMNALADRHGFVVIYPEQSRGANAQTCWNWFSPNDQRRGRGEPEILSGIAQKTMAQYDVPADKTFVAGLSAGAAMAVILGHTYPDVFAAAGAHSGLPYKAAKDVASAFAAMTGQTPRAETEPASAGVRTIVFHGSADRTVHAANSETIAHDAERHIPSPSLQSQRKGMANGCSYTATICTGPEGHNHAEHWVIDGLGHAWSGGQPGGSYTDPRGPDASAEMIRFFFQSKNEPT